MNEFVTLIHAQWRSLSKLFYCVIGMEVGLTLLVYLGEGSGSDGSVLVTLFTARTIWVALLLLPPGDDDRLSLNMPEFLRYLPVDAWKIGAARMFLGAVTCFVLSLADSTLYYALFDARFEQQLPIFEALWATPFVNGGLEV